MRLQESSVTLFATRHVVRLVCPHFVSVKVKRNYGTLMVCVGGE